MRGLFTPGVSYRIHFIGIGGISMSGLAEYFAAKGHKVSGCDRRASALTEALAAQGIPVAIGHDPSHLEDVDIAVYTAAIPRDQPEMAAARAMNLPVVERAVLLGEVAATFPTRIGVSGTHGKTTTTGMIGLILTESGLDPTIFIGGVLDQIGGNYRIGGDAVFLTEADEYVESFLRLEPTVAAILNIEPDHPDFFRDLAHLKGAFSRFAELVPPEGSVVARTELPNVAEAVAGSRARVISFGVDARADYQATGIEFDRNGLAAFTPVIYGRVMPRVQLCIPGTHNVQNALAAMATVGAVGVEPEAAAAVLGKYHGTRRRFEYRGRYNEAMVIDDYAHHPTEVRATLSAARNCPHNRIWCVFQPHTFSRTKTLLNDFAAALALADRVVLADIYAAREVDKGEIHARDLQQRLDQLGQEAVYLPSFAEIVEHLAKSVKPGDLVLTMGAGDINRVGEMLLAEAGVNA
ncbi:MAG: UDP-N-acetylmuramate--L-alanine ligase [Patescibacteria group bacterium]